MSPIQQDQIQMSDKHSWRSFLRPRISTNKSHDLEFMDARAADVEAPRIHQPSKAELGKHANESQMPRWLHKVLESGDEIVTKEVLDTDGVKRRMKLKVVETPGIVNALAQLARSDPTTVRATLCDPRIHHVAKLRREGSFCGYRNIQMLITYICNAKLAEHKNFSEQPLPSVFQLQDLIESAWDQGYNTSSRDEIGSIRMTRKFIGTSEVEALLLSLKTPLVRKGFASTEKTPAIQFLIQYVSDYFGLQQQASNPEKAIVTQKSPIFLQRPGHSMTIVGIHEDIHKQTSLIVFDPKFRITKEVQNVAVAGTITSRVKPQKSLKHYRYGLPELGTNDVFEIVHLDGHVISPS